MQSFVIFVIFALCNQVCWANPAPTQCKPQNGDHLTWQTYHRLADIHRFLDYLAATYPDLCTVDSIGDSYEGRPLKMIKVSNGNASNKAYWIDGGIHGREWISPAAVTFILADLVINWMNQPEYIHRFDWYILPVLNPDGYEYTQTHDRYWRKNRRPACARNDCVGVDLNRNYDIHWGRMLTEADPCSVIYGGEGPFTEPETLAHKHFFETSGVRFDAFVTFHTFGQAIFYPWGFANNSYPADVANLKSAAAEAAQKIREIDGKVFEIGTGADLVYLASGQSVDWAKSMGIPYTYCIELRGDWESVYQFELPADEIVVAAQEAKAATFVFAHRAVAWTLNDTTCDNGSNL